MTSLYNLSAEMRELLSLAEDGDAGFFEALSDTIGAQSEMIDEKIEAHIFVTKQLESDAQACKDEAKRLSDRAKRLESNADTCKQRVIEVMQQLGKDKVKRQLLSITLAKPRQVVAIDDDTKLPREYVSTKVVRTPDKRLILECLKKGEMVPGCRLDEGKPSLRIS